jgi:hypothetical protein
MAQIPSSEVNSSLNTEGIISSILLNRKSDHKKPILPPILSQINPVHIFPNYLFKNNLNITSI